MRNPRLRYEIIHFCRGHRCIFVRRHADRDVVVASNGVLPRIVSIMRKTDV